MKDLILFGAGGYCKDVLSIVRDINLKQRERFAAAQGASGLISAESMVYRTVSVVDPFAYYRGVREILGAPVYDTIEEWTMNGVDRRGVACELIVTIGDPDGRENQVRLIQKEFQRSMPPWATLIHPDTTIGLKVEIRHGCIIAAGSRIMSDTGIDAFTTLNLNAIVGHDCMIGQFCTLGPSCNVLGKVELASHVDVGTGAIILPGKSVAKGVKIGAGAVITKNISIPGSTWVGVPADLANLQAGGQA